MVNAQKPDLCTQCTDILVTVATMVGVLFVTIFLLALCASTLPARTVTTGICGSSVLCADADALRVPACSAWAEGTDAQ